VARGFKLKMHKNDLVYNDWIGVQMFPNPVSSLFNRTLKKQKAEILRERSVPPVQQQFYGSSG